ncbi:hypothetical protein C8Q76DRAFT_802369 [Earliella scabrosa]|nr:hypothetical protein C8Q76DRAFT_802369 [Earliella scabrosa]
MLFFSFLAIFAPLAFSAVASAMPFNHASPTFVRTGAKAPDGVAAVLNNAYQQLVPITEGLKFMNNQNATVEALAPSMNQMRDILSETISSLRLLSNQPRDVIFSGINSGINFNNNAQLLSFGDIFNLLGLLLSLIVPGLTAITGFHGSAIPVSLAGNVSLIGSLLGTVITLVLGLLAGVLGGVLNGLLGGLLLGLLGGILTTFVNPIIPDIRSLNIAALNAALSL